MTYHAPIWTENRTKPETFRSVETLDAGTFWVYVEKVGGGTKGKRYTGDWRFEVQWADQSIVLADVLTTGTPKSHKQVAELAVHFLGLGS